MRFHSWFALGAVATLVSTASAQGPRVPTGPAANATAQSTGGGGGALLPPSNDDCTTPMVISGTGSFPIDNTGATTGTQGQHETLCASGGPYRDLWYTWTASVDGLATVEICAASPFAIAPKIVVYVGTGCPADGSALACDYNGCSSGSYGASVTFPTTAGQPYTVQIGRIQDNAPPLIGAFAVTTQGSPGPTVPASLNVDISALAGTPSSTYGAGAGQAGYWNAVTSAQNNVALNDLNGAPAHVVLTHYLNQGVLVSNTDYSFDNAGTTGDDQALMDDWEDLEVGSATWTFTNLHGGDYTVYTYAWASDSATYRSLVTGAGSSDPAQTIGGAWPGSQQQGITYAVHRFLGIPDGGSVRITITRAVTYGTLNGFQLRYDGSSVTSTTFCAGDGTASACPCGNSGRDGNGCENSAVVAGARLNATGVASVSADSLVLHGSGMPNSFGLYFQGTTQQNGGMGTIFGDGLRCAGGTNVRLGTKLNSGNASQYPDTGDTPISVKGMIPAGGGSRTYQVWYRNTSGPCGSGFNLTNGAQVVWAP